MQFKPKEYFYDNYITIINYNYIVMIHQKDGQGTVLNFVNTIWKA